MALLEALAVAMMRDGDAHLFVVALVGDSALALLEQSE